MSLLSWNWNKRHSVFPLDFYDSQIREPKEKIKKKLKLLTLSIYIPCQKLSQTKQHEYPEEYKATFFISVIATLVYCTQSQPQLASYGGGRTGQGYHKPLWPMR